VREEIALTAEDRAILALEGPTLVGHTCKVIVLAGETPSTAALAERVSARIAQAPALARRLGGTVAKPAWIEDAEFDPRAHVLDARVAAPLDRSELRVEVARLFAERLARDRPLWRIDRVQLLDGGCALVWRIHHSLADGSTAMRYARTLLWDASSADRSQVDGGRGVADRHALTDEQDQARRRAHLARFFAREFSRSVRDSPFDGRIGARREIAFATVPLVALHDAAKALAGATLNDAVLSVVSGGLRRWIEQHHGPVGSVRVKVPVSLHHEGEDAGNRDSFFSVSVPLAEPDAAARLRAVHAATAVRKAEHDAETMDTLLRRLREVSPELGRFCERVERSPRTFAVNVSNVPGPREPVSVLGAPVGSLHSIAEIAKHHALRVAVVSLAGSLCLGFCADPEIVEDVQSMAEGTEIEATTLIAAA
jgi:diacylglycerol O-acyltransferase / wax synthase